MEAGQMPAPPLVSHTSAVAAEQAAELIAPCLAATTERSLLVYLHIPFCSSKCVFCDWVTDIPVPQLRSGPSVRAAYVSALCAQIRSFGPRLSELGYVPKHVYWGGGTPSKLSSSELEVIVDALATTFDLPSTGEHTLETSPETLTAEKLQCMRRLGVNRISMGVQSFDDGELRRAARAHSALQAEQAVHLIHEAGFENLNLDLIVALPEQTPEILDRTLAKTVELNPRHVTVYIYRATANTVMAKQIGSGQRRAQQPGDVLRFYDTARRALEQAGYTEYAVGYFMKDDTARFMSEEYYFALEGDYVGFGSGAESILGHHRLQNAPARLHEFIERPAWFDSCERFSPQRIESLFQALRLTMLTSIGIDYRRFERLFGFPFAQIRRHPYLRALMRYYSMYGTEFVETPERLYVTEGSRRQAYLASLQRAFKAAS